LNAKITKIIESRAFLNENLQKYPQKILLCAEFSGKGTSRIAV
jgi:hypothetical protein